MITRPLLFFLLFVSAPLLGQLWYVNTYAPSWEKSLIYRVEPDFSYSTVVMLNGQVSDIALTPDGQMYGIQGSSLVTINLESGELTFVALLPSGDYSSSLVSSNDGRLFTLAKSGVLYAYNLQKDSLELIDYLGVFGQHADDITFYSGNIIMQGYNNSQFFAYNLQDKDITKVLCNLGIGDDMNAICNHVDSCGEETVFGITRRGHVYEFDFDNNTLHLLHEYGSLNFSGYGMATTTEHMASTCYTPFTGEACNPVGTEELTSENEVILYPNPADHTMFLNSAITIEYIRVFSSLGQPIKTLLHPSTSIDVADLISGVYIFSIYGGGKHWNQIVSIR